MKLRTIFLVLWIFSSQVLSGEMPDLPGDGLVAEGNKNWQQAVSIYLDFLTKNPQRADIWVRVAIIEHELQNYPIAIDAYQHALLIQPQNAEIHKNLSEIYSELNKPKEALAEINAATQWQPHNIRYWEARAAIANWNKEPEIALDSYQQINDLNKKAGLSTLSVWVQMGSLQSQLQRYSEALASYQQALKISPRDPVIYQNISQIYAAMKKPEQAMDAINLALAIEPNRIEFLSTKAMLANWLKDSHLAFDTYQQILKLSPTNSTAQQGMSLIKQQLSMQHQQSPLPLSPYEEWLNKANEAALLHQYKLAATAMKEAIALKPNNADLYKKLSEIYASAKEPRPALTAIRRAILLAPKNITYWRAQAKLAAWIMDKNLTLKSYLSILQLKPCDEDAMLNLAHALAWQGRTDDAIKAYRQFLQIYPRVAEGWIQYAEVVSWTQSYLIALEALERYRQLKGETFEYCETKARILALIGRFRTAMMINSPLLQKKPNDPYLLSTEITALGKANQINKAVYYLNKLENLQAEDRMVKGVSNIIRTPLRSNISIEASYTSATDTTRILDIPLTVQYFLSPDTSLLFWGLYERATAAWTSPLRPIAGGTAIADESAMGGFTTQTHGMNLKALVGDLKIQNESNHIIYEATANTNLNETAQLTVQGLHNLFRPYLIPQTPLLISLQIMETRIGGYLQWQPLPQKYLNAVMSYSDLSDHNNYVHVNLWPKARVYGSQHWLVTLGVDGDFWHFARRASDGYYSPLDFNGYEGTIEVYYAQSENVGYSISAGFGLQKDETFPHYFYEEDLAVEMFYGIFTDWELRVRGGFTLRDNPSNNYDCWTVAARLSKRF
jgi:tetratricopeptide (TPR) repeat protein